MSPKKEPSVLMVWLAYAAVYIIWGSTYFFIEMAVKHIAPMILGGVRFFIAGTLMLLWVVSQKEKIWNLKAIFASVVSGFLMLFLGNGSVILAEQHLVSSFVAIFVASSPIWFLVLDRPNWNENFKNKFIISGVIMGIVGVLFLFYEKLGGSGKTPSGTLWALFILIIGNIGWTMGSLYSKYTSNKVAASVISAWQMISAGLIFLVVSMIDKTIFTMQWQQVPLESWLAVGYLIIFGSIIGYSAYVFLLSVRNATQVSSYAYVNPVVAVILGVFINKEHLTFWQLIGLVIILCSVFFINKARRVNKKYAGEVKKSEEQ